MCTLSVLRAPLVDVGGEIRFRAVFNRDERLDRAEAVPPVVGCYGTFAAVHPVDPEGSGTWIAATAAGLVFALMNEAETCLRADAPISRGLVIPGLLSAATLEAAEDRLSRYAAERHRPFRLLVLGRDGVVEAARTDDGFAVRREPPVARLVRTSSSVHPGTTCPRRLALFDTVVAGQSAAAQDRFHAHHWAADAGASVLMQRADARTVSVTVLELLDRTVRMSYRALPAGILDVTELELAA